MTERTKSSQKPEEKKLKRKQLPRKRYRLVSVPSRKVQSELSGGDTLSSSKQGSAGILVLVSPASPSCSTAKAIAAAATAIFWAYSSILGDAEQVAETMGKIPVKQW